MSDSFVEVTSQSWLSRIGESIKGALLGLLFFALAFPVLFWNEGRAIKRHNALTEGASQVTSVSADRVDEANEGKLVHVYGKVKPNDSLVDATFGISGTGLQLVRTVEMYQWLESKEERTEKKMGGGTETETTYSYRRDWSEKTIRSSDFKKPDGHQNPERKTYESQRWTAQDATMGEFSISPRQISQIGGLTRYLIDSVPYAVAHEAVLVDNRIYFGVDPSVPQIGDLRVSFQLAPAQDASIVARQMGDRLTPHVVEAGSIELIERGIMSAELMFQRAEASNALITWAFRFGALLAMTIGLYMMFKVLAVFGDIMPFVGSIIAGGLGIVSLLVATSLSALTIAIAWMYYRPLVGIALLVIAVLCAVAVKVKASDRDSSTAQPKMA